MGDICFAATRNCPLIAIPHTVHCSAETRRVIVLVGLDNQAFPVYKCSLNGIPMPQIPLFDTRNAFLEVQCASIFSIVWRLLLLLI